MYTYTESGRRFPDFGGADGGLVAEPTVPLSRGDLKNHCLFLVAEEGRYLTTIIILILIAQKINDLLCSDIFLIK
jgi:hypothetical protein